MKYLIRTIISLFFILFSLLSHAGKDPISWTVSALFPSQTSVGQTYTVTYTFTNQLPMRLVKALIIEHSASPASEFSFEDKCSGRLLFSGESCTVVAALNPMLIGTKTLQLTIAGYSRDRVPLPQISTFSTGQSLSPIIGNVTDSLPSRMTLGSSATYQFSFINQSQTVATNLSVNVIQSLGTPSFTTNCNTTLAPNGGTCLVEGTYTATASTPSIQQVAAQLSYAGPLGSPTTVRTLTLVTNPASPLVGTLVPPNYLPPLLTPDTQYYTVQFLFTASGTVDITSNGTIACLQGNSDCTGNIIPVSSSCFPQTLTNAACQMTARFTTPAASNPPKTYTITAQVPYSVGGTPQTPATAQTSGTVVATLPTSRTVTVKNECNFDVWFSLNGAQLNNSPTCYQDTDCPAGASCDAVKTNKCFWTNPSPTNLSYLLAANGGSNNVTINVNPGTDPNIQWSGNISASLNCSGSSCQQVACNNNGGTASCAPGIGFTQPATQAEITMNLNNADSYDVEVINGFHIPISMQPVYYQDSTTTIYATADNYNCGVPGKETIGNGFGACNWNNATVPGNGFYWVTGGGNTCSITATNSGCSATTLCGLDNNFNQVCGNFLGYWSADQVCGSNNVPAAVLEYFKCNQPLPTNTTPYYPSGAVLSDLMLCAVPKGYTGPRYNTCYNPYPSYSSTEIAQCCGCVDWWNPDQTNNVAIGANSNTGSCTQPGHSQPQTNAQWNQYVQPMLQWMKQACPSAYTYPFDDKTSGFSCTNNLPGQPNSAGYIVTFCPGGITGLPSGKTDGR
ncbi:thaumatin domain-containing protein [Legionella norrlandica]|uniref:Thaumatin domain-containing protein n=1 Tax=Legionella norrlandica TaxID=1498499 RepID=A0A0A2T7V2_9GAMM|nr:Dot/Icm T4SS effector LegT [Legionella norrlandica]KGP63493.1 thaumatin domain-containing protein [Legionella norrlandica]